MRKHIELSSRAAKDLRSLDKPARTRVVGVFEEDLTADPQPENLDVKAQRGTAPWLRLRVGDHRVLYRPLTAAELEPLVADVDARERPIDGYLVERIVNPRDLDRAVTSL